MAHRSGGCSGACACYVIFAIATLATIIIVVQVQVEEGLPTHRELLSRVTNGPPISGLYGPGAWWAWLITLGMTHGHMGAGLLARGTGNIPLEWDYDLMGASIYVIIAAGDIVLKSREIVQLGDKAAESLLLPALLCAERVVSIGIGSSLFTLFTAPFVGGSAGSRRAAIAVISFTVALIASFFALRAHEAISKTAPVIWCTLHDESTNKKPVGIPFVFVDYLASLWCGAPNILRLYLTRDYWKPAGLLSFVAALFTLILGIKSVHFTLVVLTVFAFCPFILMGIVAVAGTVMWFGSWIALGWLVYILAFFPQWGYFPVTGISLSEMDQMAGLLTVAFVAGFRSLRRIREAAHHHRDSPPHERVTLLPTSITTPSTSGNE